MRVASDAQHPAHGGCLAQGGGNRAADQAHPDDCQNLCPEGRGCRTRRCLSHYCASTSASAWTKRVFSDGKPIDTRSHRSEEHTSELQSLMRISYAVFCLKKKKKQQQLHRPRHKTPTN